MPFRLLRYMVAIWEKYLQEHPEATLLPAIIPVVLHHGPGGWTSATSMAELYDLSAELYALFGPVLPSLSFVVDDLAAQTDEDLHRRAIGAIPTLVLWMFKHAREKDSDGSQIIHAMRAHVRELMRETLRARTGLHALAMLMRYILEVTGVEPAALGHFLTTDINPHVHEVLMTAAERLRQEGRAEGLETGRAEGLETGRAAGQRGVLIKQLGLRFGPLSRAALERLEAADSAQLDAWSERVLSAGSLAEVFAEP